MRYLVSLMLAVGLGIHGVGWTQESTSLLTGVSAVFITPRPDQTEEGWPTTLEVSFAVSSADIVAPEFAIHFFFNGKVGRPAAADRTLTARLNDWGDLELHLTPRPDSSPPILHPGGEGPPNWGGSYHLFFVWIWADSLGDNDGSLAVLVTLVGSSNMLGTVVVPDTCQGRHATHMGSAGADVLFGSPGPDVIMGFGGDDTLYGLDGEDLLCGGPGHDRLYGGPGNDTLHGDAGHDVLMGGQGADTLSGGLDHDILQGDVGTDTLSGGPGIDVCDGGSDLDTADTSCERKQTVP